MASRTNKQAKSAGDMKLKSGAIAADKNIDATDEEANKSATLAAKSRKKASRRDKLRKAAPFIKALAKSTAGTKKKGKPSKSEMDRAYDRSPYD
jgi:hypothetical protein